MKKLFFTLSVFLVIILSLVTSSCETLLMTCNSEGAGVDISKRQFIFKFPSEFRSEDDAMKSLKTALSKADIDDEMKEVNNVEFCSCGDRSLIRATFEKDIPLGIETKLSNLKEETSEEEIEGDRQFSFTVLPNESPKNGNGPILTQGEIKGIEGFYNSDKDGITIAVLDTGLDLNTQYDGRRILYWNDQELCDDGPITGWNFVNGNPNFNDDNDGVGHGTLITKLITNTLDNSSTKYRLLPLKVFNSRGKGSYWDLVCAMSYVQKIQEVTQGDIKIINASFGGDLGALKESSLKILKGYIDSVSETTLMVTSAGNCGLNTDEEPNYHYPSGYSSDNIIAVGGYTQMNDKVVRNVSSNYGNMDGSIDIASPFMHKIEVRNGSGIAGISAEGTSYSAAYVTALLAESFPLNTTEAILYKDDFIANHPTSLQLTGINDGSYVKQQ